MDDVKEGKKHLVLKNLKQFQYFKKKFERIPVQRFHKIFLHIILFQIILTFFVVF